MKIPPLILLFACLALSAISAEPQFTDVPTTVTNAETAAREAAMRRALQGALSGNTNNGSNDAVVTQADSVGTNPAPANPAPSNSTRRPFPAFPAFPTFPVNTNQPSRQRPIPVVPALNSTNPVPAAGVAGGLPAQTAPPIATAPTAGAAAVTPNPNAAAASGASTNAAEQLIPAGEINFPATDINQVLSIYGELVNRTILRPTALPAQLITLKTQTPLTRTEAIQAFDTVFAMNGITTINIGEKFVKVVPTPQAAAEAAVFDTNDMTRLPEADQYVTHIVQVTNAKPSELVTALQPFAKVPNSILAIDSSGILVIRDFSANVKRMLEMIKQIDVATPLDYDSEVIPIKYALASDIQNALSSLGGGSATSIGRSPTGGATGAGAGFSPGGYGRGTLGGGGGVGGPGTPGQQLGGAQPSVGGLNSSTRGTSFQDRLRNIVQRASSSGDFQILGQTKIIADERTNSLLVFAGKQDMKMIKDIIKKLDVVLAQVLIEAIALEVSLDDSRNLGISYLQRNPSQGGNYFTGTGAINNGSFANFGNFASTATNAAGALPSGFSYLARFGNDFDATVAAAASDSRINVLSRPTIQTSHAVPATIKIGDTVPYVTGTYFGGINGAASSQYQQTFVGINLNVTPLINPDGLVVMDISTDIEQLGNPTTIDGNPVPTTTERSAQAKVSVKDRDTIILGGFITSTKSDSKSGVPILKDIPLLGYLFRSTSASNKRVELIILIRPTVLPTPEAAALVATSERNKLPGVKAAEAEYRRDALRRQKEADKIQMPEGDDSKIFHP